MIANEEVDHDEEKPVAGRRCGLADRRGLRCHRRAPRSASVVKEVLTKELPNIPGKEAMILSVEYPPGGADPIHRHDANAFVYVLEGSVVMAV